MADSKWSGAGFTESATVALTDKAVGLVGGANARFTLTVLQAALTKVGVVNVTQPASSATLTIPDGTTLNTGAGGTLGALSFITPGTGVATALAVNVGSAGAPVLFNGALGTPSSGNLANCTGYPAQAAAGSNTQVQFNDAGSFGGNAGFTYNKTTNVLSLNGSANTLNLAGSAAAAPVVLSATGSDTNICIKLSPKGNGFTQFGPQTYGPFDAYTEAYGTSVPSGHSGHYVESVLANTASGFLTGNYVSVATQAGGAATQDLLSIFGARYFADSYLPTGRTLGLAAGFEAIATNHAAGTITDAYGMYGTVTNTSTGAITRAYGQYNLVENDSTGIITNAYGTYNEFLNFGTVMTNAYAFWSKAMGGVATNPYSFWSDEQGVFRIKADNTYNSVYQAIAALYNPQITKYVAGAANFERIVLGQWNSNVAEVGTEAGGTGTQRNLRLLGAAVNVPSLTASNWVLTDASKNLVSKTNTQATALLDAMVGDSGAGGTKGLVPAPAMGDAAKVLSGAGTWITNGAGSGASTALDNLAAVAINAALVLATSDAFALGSATKQWADLFLAEGAVINWDNGDATCTQTANDITWAGITSFGVGTSTAVTLGTIELGAATDTTLSRASAGVAAVEGVNLLASNATGVQTFLTTPSSANLLAAVTDETGTGALVFANTPTLVTPVLGAATATSVTSSGQNQLSAGSTTLLVVPTADPSATGNINGDFNSGYSSSAIGDLVYLDSSATWQKCDANTLLLYNGLLAIALEVKASGNALKVALPGSFVYAATAFPTFTIGGPIFMSETAGAVTQTAPTTTDAATRVIGWAVHADKMYFFPSPDYITHT